MKNNEAQNELFEGYLTKHFGHTADQRTFRNTKKAYIRHNYAKLLPADKNAHILDIGPGFGELIEFVAKDSGYPKVEAIDLSQEVVDFCNTVVPGSSIRVDDTAQYFREHSGRYDLIFMMHVLEHIPKAEIIPLLNSIRSALRPGGKFIVEVPNMGSPMTGLFARYADFTHEVGFTELSLPFVLTSAGFARADVFPMAIPPDRWYRPGQILFQKLISFFLRAIQVGLAVRSANITSHAIFAVATHD